MNISDENAIKTQNEPQSFETIIERLNLIVGKSITELAKSVNVDVPISPLHGKGFVGELLEILLGATAKNQSIPDFPKLGLELKSIPVDSEFKVLESTFLCHAPLSDIRNLTFENSSVYAKIKRVLFVIVNGQRDLGFEHRRVLGYFFYSPGKEELDTLKQDFNELYEMVKTGLVEEINARLGHIIQMRPKGANGKALTECTGPDGKIIKTRPRGFYIRRKHTQKLVDNFIKNHQKAPL